VVTLTFKFVVSHALLTDDKGSMSTGHRLMTTGRVSARIARCAVAVTFLQLPFVSDARGQGVSGSNWRLSAEPIFTVGRAAGRPEELFSRIVSALRLSDGRFVVADGIELRISVYDSAGRLQSMFGRSGSGPGEYRSIGGIWSIGHDTIGVWDGHLQRITHVLTHGEVVRTHTPRYDVQRPPAAAGTLDAFLGAFPDGRLALAWLAASRGAPDALLPDQMVIGLFEADGSFQKVLGRVEGMIRIHKPGVGGGPIPFSPFPWAAVVQRRLVFTSGVTGDIAVFDVDAASEAPVATVRSPSRELALRDAWRELDKVLDGADPGPLLALARSMDRSVGRVPQIARMFADEQGHLWVKPYEPRGDAMPVRRGRYAAGGRWTIIDMTGRVVGHITFPPGIAPVAADGSYLLGIARDSLDVEGFTVHRILR
jgi:hypothetical protein